MNDHTAAAAHTPGRWRVLRHDGNVFVIKNDGLTIAEITYQLPDKSGETSRNANARLIAAAPDMLAALLEALEFAEQQEDVIDGNDGPQANAAMTLAQTLRDVIAKATGGEA